MDGENNGIKVALCAPSPCNFTLCLSWQNVTRPQYAWNVFISLMCFYLWGSASDPTKEHQVLQPEKKKREAEAKRRNRVCFPPLSPMFFLYFCSIVTESAALCGGSRDRRMAWVVWTRTDLFFMDLCNWYDLRFAVIREVQIWCWRRWEGEATVLECVFIGTVACSYASASGTFFPFDMKSDVVIACSRLE